MIVSASAIVCVLITVAKVRAQRPQKQARSFSFTRRSLYIYFVHRRQSIEGYKGHHIAQSRGRNLRLKILCHAKNKMTFLLVSLVSFCEYCMRIITCSLYRTFTILQILFS